MNNRMPLLAKECMTMTIRLIKVVEDKGAVYGALVPADYYEPGLDGYGLNTSPWVWQQIEALVAEVAELRVRVKTEQALTGTVEDEWCVWYGGDDPNECAGRQVYDDQADAEEMVQWIVGGRLAHRNVHLGPWQPFETWPVCVCPDCIRCGCGDAAKHHIDPATCVRVAVADHG